MASETFNKLINIDINAQSVGSLNKSLKEIDDEIKSIQENEVKVNQSLEEQEKALKDIAKLEASRNKVLNEKVKLEEKSITQTEKTAKNLESQQKKAEQLFKTAEGVGGAFQVAAGASLLLGEETSEALSKAQAKVIAIVSVTDGLKKVAEGAANGYKLVSEGIKKAEIGAKLFGNSAKAAMAATGIGLLVVALVLIVEYFDEISAAAKKFSQSIGLDKVLEDFNAFFDSIGGLSGALTVLGGVVEGYFKAVVGYFKILGKLLTLDFKGVKEQFVETSNEVQKAVADSVAKAQKDAAHARLIKAKETAIKESEQEIAILKARGKDTLKLEEALIKERIALENLRLDNVEKGSKAEIEINDKKNAQLVAAEANKKAQADKYYNERLTALQIQSNKEIKIINDKVEKENLTESQGQELLLLQQQLYNEREIKLRKSHGDDVSALVLKQQEVEKQLVANNLKQREDALNKLHSKEILALQEARKEDLITQETYESNVAALELKSMMDSLLLIKEGTQAHLDAEIAINEKIIANDYTTAQKRLELEKNLANEKVKLQDYINSKILGDANKDASNIKNSFKIREAAIRAGAEAESAILESSRSKQADIDKKNGFEDLAAAAKFAQQEIDIEESKNDKLGALNVARIDSIQKGFDIAFSYINQLNDIANNIQQGQIDAANENIDKLTEKGDEIQSNIDKINQAAEESSNKVNELEKSLSDARGERSNVLSQQLEDERGKRAKLLKDAEKEKKEKIKNLKDIEREQQKVEELELQRKRRAKQISLAEATINMALAISKAAASAPFPASLIPIAFAALTGGLQIAAISSQKLEDGGVIEGPSHKQGGVKGTGRFNNIEVEGGEFVVNKRATAQYRSVLESINNGSGLSLNKFESGGVTPDFASVNSLTSTTNSQLQTALDKPIYVSVQEFNTVNTRVKTIENEASI